MADERWREREAERRWDEDPYRQSWQSQSGGSSMGWQRRDIEPDYYGRGRYRLHDEDRYRSEPRFESRFDPRQAHDYRYRYHQAGEQPDYSSRDPERGDYFGSGPAADWRSYGSGYESRRYRHEPPQRPGNYRTDYRGDDYRGDYSGARQGSERGLWDRTKDEVRSWMGDEAAEQRRRMDEQRAASHSGRGPRGYTRSDERVREDINDRLTDDWEVDASDIEVQVSGGEVTLNGHVRSRREKRRAEDIADMVSGVRHVQNNLRVRSSDDAAIAASTKTGERTSEGGAAAVGAERSRH